MKLYPKIDPSAEGDVVLAYAHNGSVANCFMDSVLAAFAEDARRGSAPGGRRRLLEYHPVGGPYIYSNRCRAVKYFLECTDKQWIWMLDNDMDFPVDTLYRMLQAAEEFDTRILGAAYWNTYPGMMTYLSWLLLDPNQGVIALPSIPDTRDPVQITAVGMGCTLIHRSVLEDVTDSYPGDPWPTFGADVLYRFEDGTMTVARSPDDLKEADGEWPDKVLLEDPERMGEDVTFCLRAQKEGYSTFGLPSLTVDHFKTHRVEHGMPEFNTPPALAR